jgi:hypothetical protein
LIAFILLILSLIAGNKNASDWWVRGVGRSRVVRERYIVVVVVIAEITRATWPESAVLANPIWRPARLVREWKGRILSA